MGGKAFTKGPHPLLTPRMPNVVYRCLLRQYREQLDAFFELVANPIEAPEKATFGDIDVLVARPKVAPFEIETVAKALNAQRTLSFPPLYSLAVPYPGIEGSFVQLDVHICKADDFEWKLFHASHGDLWNLIGTSIRSFGLTANDKGLHLRIPEIEHENRKRSMVFLTAEPDTVLGFLGLNKDTYARPIDTVEAMFEYTCSCRLFRPEPYKKVDLKSNDRKRMGQRELFRQFVEEFLPSRISMAQNIGDAAGVTREDVYEEVLERFGKREEAETRIRAWRQERDELEQKQATRRWRKEQAQEDNAYADAWINVLKSKA
ncbi:MAG: hypothetical protein Q9209_004640 [Squamulea sp. 1 TL-2023]